MSLVLAWQNGVLSCTSTNAIVIFIILYHLSYSKCFSNIILDTTAIDIVF